MRKWAQSFTTLLSCCTELMYTKLCFQVNSAFYPSGQVNRVPACQAGARAGRGHLCDAIWQVTLRSSEMGFHEELYVVLSFQP